MLVFNTASAADELLLRLVDQIHDLQLLPFKVADLLLRGLDFVPERLIFVVFADQGLLGLVFRQLAPPPNRSRSPSASFWSPAPCNSSVLAVSIAAFLGGDLLLHQPDFAGIAFNWASNPRRFVSRSCKISTFSSTGVSMTRDLVAYPPPVK
jgi:hypothetical protein